MPSIDFVPVSFLTVFHSMITLHQNLLMRMRISRFQWLASMMLAGFFFLSCGKDDDPTPSGAAYQGDFVSAAHNTSGVASVDSNGTTLTLTNFKTDSGPDLNIYLASSLSTIKADYIDLGDSKGRNGTYSYDIPAQTDFDTYKYVVVWCVDFDVNFGYAVLQKQ